MAANVTTTMPPENATNATTNAFVVNEKAWTANIAVNATVIVISVYVTTALSMYQYLRSRRVGANSRRNERERRFALVARVLCILVSFLATVFVSLKLALTLAEHDPTEDESRIYQCNVLLKTANATLFFSTFLAYLFLWTRQRVFYIHKALKPLNSKVLTVISYVVLGVWIFYCLTATAAVVLVPKYRYHPSRGCVITDGRPMKFISASFVIVCAFMQVSLLVLFLYPIVRRYSVTSEISRSRRPSSENRSLQRVVARIKKAVIISVVCIVTDIITPILSTATYTSAFTSFYPINLMINMFCIILCFDNWGRMLVPCMKPKIIKKIKPASTPNSSQQFSRTSNNTRSSL